jgi:hypothetical protein
MTPEFIERIKRDYIKEPIHIDWDSYLAGYLACLKRFTSTADKESGELETQLRNRSTYSGHDL